MTDLDKNKALQFMQKQSGMVLSTLSPDNTLESAYLFYAVNDQLDLFVMTKRSTEKYLNIKNNPQIAFVITDEDNLITLQAKGEVAEITSGPASITAFNSIMEVMTKKIKNWPPPLGKIKGGEMKEEGIVILKISPKWWRIRDYANSKDFVSDSAE